MDECERPSLWVVSYFRKERRWIVVWTGRDDETVGPWSGEEFAQLMADLTRLEPGDPAYVVLDAGIVNELLNSPFPKRSGLYQVVWKGSQTPMRCLVRKVPSTGSGALEAFLPRRQLVRHLDSSHLGGPHHSAPSR